MSVIPKLSAKQLAELDRRYVWHPFTQMRDWMREEPTMIVSGKGATLKDAGGRRYLDANSSIWTNLHGHGHPGINSALKRQLGRIAHSSALGFANEPSSVLAEKLVGLAPRSIAKVFYADDGSTALEAALKMAYQARARSSRSSSKAAAFLGLEGGYHGDTVGAMSLGGSPSFHAPFAPLMFPTERVMAPYCYRCPHNQARAERADARVTRKCNWECIGALERKFSRRKGAPFAGAVIEPLIQGAAGMIAHPAGYLKRFAQLCGEHKVPLIADEVMTGFGRTGFMFACEKEKVRPDLLCLAKGLTGGYLPLGATLASQEIFNAFLGSYEEKKTFFHGHSYSGNQLGCAAALASLEIFEQEKTLLRVASLGSDLEVMLIDFWKLPQVGDVRRVGLMAGVELVKNWKTREPWRWEDRVGIRVCEEARRRGVLTRPIGNVLVIMPPYCVTTAQLAKICDVLKRSIHKVCGGGKV